ncbi:TlpA family protein disulfide reductase [Formosa sediminum]|uniref:TlpA family protein disulfide reductase n=1 Tax=Formosa sediminum TaxID=2594004 RepID=A0A516GMC7_9FLAO|nr:TlpA disulfide reductase family protein [Formosa sediminum]QDO92667.1 TlpA family protein disulfide reductase [Formosa sediminum]
MKKLLLILIVLWCFACKRHDENKTISKDVIEVESVEQTRDLTVYNFETLAPLLELKDDKVHVINFWATWCAPCVKELPHFEKLKSVYASKGVDLLLVSLDSPNVYETKLKPFLIKHNIKSRVIALNDVQSNIWIPKIEASWSGSIPVTIIYNKDSRKFYDSPFTYQDLERELKTFLN